MKNVQYNFFKKMIFLAIFLAFSAASCMIAHGQVACSDDSGLLFCLRAQDRVNWLIDRTNDTMQPITLNCSKHIISTDYAYQSKLSYNVQYSTENNAACFRAMKIFNGLTQKYTLSNILPIECELIEGSKDYSLSSTRTICTMAVICSVLAVLS